MKAILTTFVLLSTSILVSCDLRSGTANEEMEKFSATPTPTPPVSSSPAATPIDPADIVQIDTGLEGKMLTLNGEAQRKTINCNEFNPVMIDGDHNIVTVDGACQRIMVNGDRNEISADAAMEFVFNGTENTLRFTRYPNGKRPSIVDNGSGNLVEKIPWQPETPSKSQNKGVK
jgi:hypothetical protein